MSKETYDTLDKEDILAMEKVHGAAFSSASGDRITARERSVVRFQALGRQVRFPIYVIDKLHEAFILGIDFIRKENLKYCPMHR